MEYTANSKTSLLALVKSALPEISPNDYKLISKACDFAKLKHKGQKRANGDDYFTGHCIPVAVHIMEMGMDPDLVCAALLHDTLEDTETTVEELVAEFGEDINWLVEGVSKVGRVKYLGNERHVESLRKFLVSVAQDLRVITLKLADRWHNLETLEYLPPEKRQRIALESIMVYSPMASRLGMGKLVSTINDLAFPYAFPEEYQRTKLLMEAKLKKADSTITKIWRDLNVELYNALGYAPKIDKRVKGTYSLYKKLVRKDWNVDEIYDIVALRAIVKTVPDCYQALGVVNNHWRPVPRRIKDYIAVPKPNGYQSLHTTVFSGDGPIVEIQIRTHEMNEFNEYGVASHHSYKNTSRQKGTSKETFAWIEQLRDLQNENLSPSEYLKRLRNDFIHDRIFVFTPKGDVIDLPEGATVLDFAFALHSDIGEHASGGKINGKFMALKTPIHSADIVEIVTSTKAHPTDKWLDQCVTNSALERIRRYNRKQHEITN